MAAGKKGTSSCQSGQTALAARLLERFASEASAEGSNLIFSPLSIHVALALMSAGAAGETLNEILAVAGAPSRDELTEFVAKSVVERVLADRSGVGGLTVAFACGAWTDKRYPLKPAYRDTIVGKFKGTASIVDFRDNPVESRKQINAWVAEATRGLITELLDPNKQSRDTVNVVVNAIYFKGEWRDPFQRENTVDHEFHRLDGSSIDVTFMQSWNYQQIACHDGFKVLKLPYKVMDVDWSSPTFNWKVLQSTPKFAMCVFLPDARDGLHGLIRKMASSPGFLHDHLPVKSVPVGEFRLPRFKLAFGGHVLDPAKEE
ncbi:hypothetical protein QOZ80_9BG0702490 [Eleusine coracana subsp. coracana]|nr:hypothetical protein QOZ80_9BG0702490 [Eleusine coracana subsp. coracana]